MNQEKRIFEFFRGIGKSLSLWKVRRLEKKYLCHPYAEGSHCNKRHLKFIWSAKEDDYYMYWNVCVGQYSSHALLYATMFGWWSWERSCTSRRILAADFGLEITKLRFKTRKDKEIKQNIPNQNFLDCIFHVIDKIVSFIYNTEATSCYKFHFFEI